MKEYRFNSDYETIAKLKGIRPISELEKEVGMYSATPEFLLKHGGPLAKELLSISTYFVKIVMPNKILQKCNKLGAVAQ